MSMEEIFAEAVERLKAGEPAKDIVASYPEADREELLAMLLLVEDLVDMAMEPAPTPSPVRRHNHRALFLQTLLDMQAAQSAAQLQTPAAAPALAPAPPPPRPPMPAPARPGLLDGLRAWLEQWRGASPLGALAFNFAPLAALLLAVYLATAWVSSTAQASVPGEPAYRIKEWAREIQTELAAPEERSELRRRNDAELQREMELLAERTANLESVAPRLSQALQFRGMAGRVFLIGPLRVLPNYQPDLQGEEVLATTIEGELVPGVPVRLDYQVLPGNPNLVQGIKIVVVGAPEPTPELAAEPELVFSTVAGDDCEVLVIPGWEPLAVFPGMSVMDIANRAGVSIFDIMSVNCLEQQVFTERGKILVPENYYIKVTPTSMPTAPAPVYRPPAPPAPTATPTQRPTRTPEPTSEPTAAPTATSEPEDAGSTTPTATPDSSSTRPTVEPTATGDTPATAAPTATPTATADTGEATATAEPTATVAAPTATATADTTDGTPAATATAETVEAAPTATPTAEPTPAKPEELAPPATATATAESVEQVATATSERAPVAPPATPRPTDPPPPTNPPPAEPPAPPAPPPTDPPPPPDSGDDGSGDNGSGGEGGGEGDAGARRLISAAAV